MAKALLTKVVQILTKAVTVDTDSSGARDANGTVTDQSISFGPLS